MRAQDILDGPRIGTAWHLAAAALRKLLRDPRRLGALLEVADILLPAPPVHRHDKDEAPAGHEADEEQPPLEFRHVAGRIGRVAERTLARG